MNKKPLTNKLSIYLIKQAYSADAPEAIFKDYEALEHETIDDAGELYYGDSYISQPLWVRKFFGSSFNNSRQDDKSRELYITPPNLKIFTASSKATLLAKVNGRTFAITFGYGRTLLKPGVWEERFGLKVALNVIDSDKLRSIDKKSMAAVPKLSREQLTKVSTLADFGVDVERDLVQGITGKAMDSIFGETVTGKDALSISVKLEASNVTNFLRYCYEKYKSNDYKKYFAWIDHTFEIKDSDTIEKLNQGLLNKIEDDDLDNFEMSIPDIIDWENIDEFRFKKHSFGDDLDLSKCLNFLRSDNLDLSIETFKKQRVGYFSNGLDKAELSWRIYDCLYCEIKHGGQMYILSGGKWYRIDDNFAQNVFTSFDDLIRNSAKVSLPPCNQGEHEDKYNERVAQKNASVCNMDRKVIYHGGTNQKVEFCDLLTIDKKIIHVKHYGASSVLSHLFSQGLVSGELFLSGKEFRRKLNEKFDEIGAQNHKLKDISQRPNLSQYEIVFAIISKSNADLNIPFFSKVNLRHTENRLKSLGYKVSLLKIPTK